MIRTFRNRHLRDFFETGAARRLPVQNTARVRRILTLLHAAVAPADMNLPGLHWHNLAPGQPSRYSVWVSGNYRVTFAFEGRDAVDVDLEDYH